MHLPRCEDYREPAKGDLTAFAHAWTSAAEVGASSLRHHRGGRTGRFGLQQLAGTCKSRGTAISHCFARFAAHAGLGQCLACIVETFRSQTSEDVRGGERVCEGEREGINRELLRQS